MGFSFGRIKAAVVSMRGTQAVFILGGLAVISTAVVGWQIVHAKPRVSATVVGYTTNWASPNVMVTIANTPCAIAVIAVTNQSQETLRYLGFGLKDEISPTVPVYSLFQETGFGWTAARVYINVRQTLPMREFVLEPKQGFTFHAIVESDKRCKVAFSYNDGPSWIAKQLPSWLAAKLPLWFWGVHTARTEAIDLRPKT